MSNHIDPKIQEIERRHAEEQAELDKRECGTFVRQEHQDRAYLLSEVERLQEENHAMKEALEWYGDKKTYETNLNDQWEPVTLIDQDLGEKAREALSHLKGE